MQEPLQLLFALLPIWIVVDGYHVGAFDVNFNVIYSYEEGGAVVFAIAILFNAGNRLLNKLSFPKTDLLFLSLSDS